MAENLDNLSLPNRVHSGELSDHELLDLLVDDELSADEVHSLLERMEEEPSLWKECVHGFLEARCWQQGLHRDGWETLCQEIYATWEEHPEEIPQQLKAAASASLPIAPREPVPTAEDFQDRGTPQDATQPHTKLRWTWFATAASWLFLAFGLGWIGANSALWLGWNPFGTSPSQIAEEKKAASPLPDESALAKESSQPRRLRERSESRFVNDAQRPATWPPASRSRMLTPQEFNQMLPPERLQDLQEAGHSVEKRRRYITVELENGKRLFVPIDQIQVTPQVPAGLQ
ncbi:Hypothetical protein PBC10988_41110 [Planctomycetales bacterium 10988]|nr:Hypothetical protein PBC10988_41110 [Planctomycetales bacterium 10988]